MAAIRVYLLTCRRPQLLRRALCSLIAQTFADWKCELHNDAPEDDTPARVLAELTPFACSCSGNLRETIRALGFRRTHAELWAWLRAQTAASTNEARQESWTALAAGS